jgi:hypothetical protein
MPTPETEFEKLEKMNKLTRDSQGRFKGYEFQKDTVANQMAFLFGGEEGEKEAARILKEAEERFKEPLRILEKKKFIEDEIKKWASSADENLRKACGGLDFDKFRENSATAEGRAANDKAAFDMLQGLGLNVHPDNVSTNYHEGPPEVIIISWINRPTPNLAAKDSNINKLANSYADCCPFAEKAKFEKDWGTRQAAAQTGGPKVDREQFLADAKKASNEYVQGKQPGLSELPDAPPSPGEELSDEPPQLH